MLDGMTLFISSLMGGIFAGCTIKSMELLSRSRYLTTVKQKVDTVVREVRERPVIQAKSNGRRMPKVNDDQAAWARENDK